VKKRIKVSSFQGVQTLDAAETKSITMGQLLAALTPVPSYSDQQTAAVPAKSGEVISFNPFTGTIKLQPQDLVCDGQMYGVITGSGLTPVSDVYGSISATYPEPVQTVTQASFDELKKAHDDLTLRFSNLESMFWPMYYEHFNDRTKLLTMERIMQNAQLMWGDEYKLANTFSRLEMMDTRMANLERRIDWDANSILKQLQEVRGHEFRYCY
jgi:hypothetical protein